MPNADLAGHLLRHAAQRPNDVAIVTAARSWTWAEFADAVDRCCADEAWGSLPCGAAIGWLGFNSVSMLATLLACARLGLRFVPVNWRLAKPELDVLARHAGLAAWHADPSFASVVQGWPRASNSESASTSMPGDLLLVYTSGTTGDPKGAVHTQAAMRANIESAIDAQGFDDRTHALAVLPMFHVGGLCIQLLPTLAAGGTVTLHERFDAAAWLEEVQNKRPTTSLMVPATMRAVVEHPRWASTDLSSLRFVSAGSSIVPRALIDAFHARGVPVAQVYGATETGPVTMVLRPGEAMAHPGSVGHPAKHVQVKLVDGEVWVRAPNLARGYHRRPDDEAFADGWFRTGDLARVDAQGRHEIVGRAKELIISGGENIHPAEIENLALADAAVAEACAVALKDERWGEVPVLVLVAHEGRTIDNARLHAAFASGLARFKHPRHIVVVPEIPKTALGKVARAEVTTLVQARLA
jgi:fatty-acyl-CoA synthase